MSAALIDASGRFQRIGSDVEYRRALGDYREAARRIYDGDGSDDAISAVADAVARMVTIDRSLSRMGTLRPLPSRNGRVVALRRAAG